MNLLLYQKPVVELFHIQRAVDDQHHHDYGGRQHYHGESGQRNPEPVGTGRKMSGSNKGWYKGVGDQHRQGEGGDEGNVDPKPL